MAEANKIDALIGDLSSHDGFVRQRARNTLVEIGEPAVDALIRALDLRDNYAHWEAAKALSQIGSPRSVQTLVQRLEDDEFSVRWMAAEGLIAVGKDSLVPLLQALVDRAESIRLREGAHHVLHDLRAKVSLDRTSRAQISSVLASLDGVEPEVEVPLTANKALQVLTGKE